MTCFYTDRSVKHQGKTIINQLHKASDLQIKQEKLRMKREFHLLKTLAATVIAVSISWLPFALNVLFFSSTVPAPIKRVSKSFCNYLFPKNGRKYKTA